VELHKIKIRKWQFGLFKPYRYKVIYGGRGSGKSWAIADALILISLDEDQRCLILCGREFQNSIKDSVHSLLKQRIEALGLVNEFDITYDQIIHKCTGSRFIFKGLRNNISSIKSMAGITHLWIEEADTLSAESWKVIKPTIRETGSEIWVSMNPKNKTDILYKEFIEPEEVLDNVYRVKVNYEDNPHFPDVLRDEMERDKARDYGYYLHVWEGECLEHSDAQVFKDKWVVNEFEEDTSVHKYFGLDFGFSQDPTAGVRCYIIDNTLYITHEAVQIGLEIDKTGQFLIDNLPDIKGNAIYADNARPETISYINKREYGFRVYSADKGKGSVEDGIEYIKSFDQVIIHKRCKHTANEFATYSYKVDERSGDITNKIIDANNHILDALRYSLERCMKRSKIDYVNKMKLNAGRF
jgi:phage terminase large subunit